MPRSDLPFGSEFSPEQIELPALLQLAHEHKARRKRAVAQSHFW